MALRKSTASDKKAAPLDLALLRQVPLAAFYAMVGKSGIPAEQARDLCRQFRELKT